MAEKALPISAAEVSIPGFAIRFNDIALRLSDRTVARQLIPRAHYICGIAHIIRVFSAHWRQPGGMISAGAFDSIDASRFLAADYLMERLRHFGKAMPVVQPRCRILSVATALGRS